MMRWNSRMAALLGPLDRACDSLAATPLDPGLQHILAAGIERHAGGSFLSVVRPESGWPSVPSASLPDLTAAECLLNHLHLSDHVSLLSVRDMARQAIKFACELGKLLVDRRYRVIVAVSDSDVTVRFHCLREGEPWLDDDLENYAYEAIAVLDI